MLINLRADDMPGRLVQTTKYKLCLITSSIDKKKRDCVRGIKIARDKELVKSTVTPNIQASATPLSVDPAAATATANRPPRARVITVSDERVPGSWN